MALGDYFGSVLSAARQGNAWAWEALHSELAGPVLGFASRHGAADPERVKLETFLQIARDVHRFDGDEQGFRAWVFVIAKRRISDQRRAAGWHRRRTDAERVGGPGEQQWLGNVEHEAMTQMSLIEVSALIRGLGAAQPDGVADGTTGDLSAADTGRILNASQGAVTVAQNRALKALRAEIAARGEALSLN